jgi:hypothetical protein
MKGGPGCETRMSVWKRVLGYQGAAAMSLHNDVGGISVDLLHGHSLAAWVLEGSPCVCRGTGCPSGCSNMRVACGI